MAAERPRVFQPGTLTVVYGKERQSIYVGGELLTTAMCVILHDVGTPVVRFTRAGPDDEKTVEEEVRAVRSAGFRVTLG